MTTLLALIHIPPQMVPLLAPDVPLFWFRSPPVPPVDARSGQFDHEKSRTLQTCLLTAVLADLTRRLPQRRLPELLNKVALVKGLRRSNGHRNLSLDKFESKKATSLVANAATKNDEVPVPSLPTPPLA